jgi:putative metallohydrolase (TIGR04338 family)
MKVLYSRPDGSVIVFDKTVDEVTYAHIERNGKKFDSKNLVQLLARGYWKPVADAKSLLASLNKYDEDQPRDELGRFGSGGNSNFNPSGSKGGNGLTPYEISKLKQNVPDTLKENVYQAQREFRPITNIDRSQMPQKPEIKNFDSKEEYDKAFREYKADWKEWAREGTRDIISKTGEEFLNGTKSGVQKYVNEVTRSDWFVEQFGDGGALGMPEVRTSEQNGTSGQYSFGNARDGSIFSRIIIDTGYTQREPTIVHEIAHYATTISAAEPHAGHGVEFAENYLFIADKVLGQDYASGLKDAFIKEGVLDGK